MVQMALRRKFSPEFKSEAVRLATQVGISVNSVANDLGIHDSLLRRWIREAASPAKARQSGSDAAELAKEVSRLRRENARLKMERDIIKKRSATSRKTRSEVCLR
jgi:transposase